MLGSEGCKSALSNLTRALQISLRIIDLASLDCQYYTQNVDSPADPGLNGAIQNDRTAQHDRTSSCANDLCTRYIVR